MLFTYHLSSTLCSAAEQAPTNCGTAAGADISEGPGPMRRVLALFLFWQGEARATILVCRAERDAANRAYRDDQLLRVRVPLHGQREEPVARLARDRLESQPFAATEL